MIVKMMINSIVTLMLMMEMVNMNKLYDLLIVMIHSKINHTHILYIHVIQVDMRDSENEALIVHSDWIILNKCCCLLEQFLRMVIEDQ